MNSVIKILEKIESLPGDLAYLSEEQEAEILACMDLPDENYFDELKSRLKKILSQKQFEEMDLVLGGEWNTTSNESHKTQ